MHTHSASPTGPILALLLSLSSAGCLAPAAGAEDAADNGSVDGGGVPDAGPDSTELTSIAATGVASGTRLKALTWNAGGGAVLPRGWHDTQLDIDCSFDFGRDGRIRCIPTGSRVGFPQATVAYSADPTCRTQRLVGHPACAPAPSYAVAAPLPLPVCGAMRALPVFTVGARHDVTTLYVDDGAGCHPVDLEPGWVTYDLGTELPAETFVGADLRPIGDTPIAAYGYVADDGAIEASAYWDTTLRGECAPDSVDATIGTRCLPSEFVHAEPFAYGDATCTTRIATGSQSPRRPCATPSVVRSFDAREPMREIGAEVPLERVHVRDDTGHCVAVNPVSDRRYYEMGAEMAPDRFVKMAQKSQGTGRVVVKRWAAEGADPTSTGITLFDTEAGLDCHPVRFADGVGCAAGNPAVLGLYFRDAACEHTVMVSDSFTGPPSMAIAMHRAANACSDIESDGAFSVGARVELTVPWVRDYTGDCHPYPQAPDTLIYFEPGEAVVLPLLTAG